MYIKSGELKKSSNPLPKLKNGLFFCCFCFIRYGATLNAVLNPHTITKVTNEIASKIDTDFLCISRMTGIPVESNKMTDNQET